MFILLIRRSLSFWNSIPALPVGISEAFKKDTCSRKVDLGVGAYRDDDGKPVILPSVAKAKSLIFNSLEHEYLPIEGSEKFISNAIALAYADCPPVRENRIASIQSISGTGALRIGIAFIHRFYPYSRSIYIPRPSWWNHRSIITHSGLEFKEYSYYNSKTKDLDLENMLFDIDNSPNNSIILFHACAHNPTGIDPTKDEWKQIKDIMAAKQHLALFDMAYQGFASGNIVNDAYALRLFIDSQIPIIVMQSFAKNFGLYGERIGNLSVVCDSKQESERVLSQLKILARSIYSSPPILGSRIVSTILETPELKNMWLNDIKVMADRIISIRSQFVNLLMEKIPQYDWSYINKQIGMFAYTGLNREQTQNLIKQHHIYLELDGRISLCGLNSKNIDYVVETIKTAILQSNNIN